MKEHRRTIIAHIRGRVQGVGFRAWTRTEAQALGLAGWVRNDPDGSVTALLYGDESAITAMLAKFRSGPPGARVTDLSTKDADPGQVEDDFRILR